MKKVILIITMLAANIAIAQDFKQGCEKPLLTTTNQNIKLLTN